MKRIFSLGMILVLLAIPVASISRAQEGGTVYTSELGLTFTYPEGWILEEDDDGNSVNFFLVTDEVLLLDAEGEQVNDLSLVMTPYETGQFGMSLSFAILEADSDSNFDMQGFEQMPPAVQTGYYMGLYTFAFSFANSFSGTEEVPTLNLVAYEDIDFQDTTAGLMTFQYGNDGLLCVGMLDESHVLFILAASAPGEIETYKESVIQVIQSIEYTPPAE